MDETTFRFFQSAWNVLGVLGLVFTAAGISAYLAFRYLGAKWLDTKFSERLESYKHAQQRELEALRFKINGLIERASKIYGKEYEHLPNLWFDLNTAFGSTHGLLGGLRFLPNLDMMNDQELEEFLNQADLREWQKIEFRDSRNKVRHWSRLEDGKNYSKAFEDHKNFRISLSKHAIFFSAEMRIEFEKVADMLWKVIVEFEIYQLNPEEGAPIERTARKEMRENGVERLKLLETAVRDRLWNAERAELS